MAETTIVPFSTLPACATECYHLYDANGACVPPAVSTAALATYANCFCSNSYVIPFSTGTAGVCDSACTTDSGGLASIHTWFSSFCSVNAAEVVTATTGGTATTGTGSSGTSTSTSTSTHSGKTQSSGQAWLSSHKQWVAFIVVVVVGIACIWIGAAMWRRRYLRKKDRQYAVGKSLAARSSTGPTSTTPGEQSGIHQDPGHGVFAPGNPNIDSSYESEKMRSGVLGRRRP